MQNQPISGRFSAIFGPNIRIYDHFSTPVLRLFAAHARD
jgi:hypothetical protein